MPACGYQWQLVSLNKLSGMNVAFFWGWKVERPLSAHAGGHDDKRVGHAAMDHVIIVSVSVGVCEHKSRHDARTSCCSHSSVTSVCSLVMPMERCLCV